MGADRGEPRRGDASALRAIGRAAELARCDAVLEVRHRRGKGLEAALALLKEAVQIADVSPVVPAIVVDRV